MVTDTNDKSGKKTKTDKDIKLENKKPENFLQSSHFYNTICYK